MMTTERGSTERFREGWERHANQALERAGYETRIDRRTLEEQGIECEAQIHVGPKGSVLEEKGLPFKSAAVEVLRIFDNVAHPIIIDYPAIDAGRSRAEFNDEIKRRNMERELDDERKRPRGESEISANEDHLHWAHRAGMVAQQKSARVWAWRANRHANRAEEEPTPDDGTAANQPSVRGQALAGIPAAPSTEMTDRRQEMTDRMAENSDMDIERARSILARVRQREGMERDRDDGGRER